MCVLLAQTDDDDRYQKHVREFVFKCATFSAADAHAWAARICLLRDPTPRDVSMGVELAESANKRPDAAHWHGFRSLWLALSEGRFDDALQLSQLCLQSSDKYCVACTHVVRAMAFRAIGNESDANKELQDLDEHVSKNKPEFQMAPGVLWPSSYTTRRFANRSLTSS